MLFKSLPSASLAVKQSSYVRKCFRCFFLGIPSCKDFTILFHRRVALHGPSSTRLLSIFGQEGQAITIYNKTQITLFNSRTFQKQKQVSF